MPDGTVTDGVAHELMEKVRQIQQLAWNKKFEVDLVNVYSDEGGPQAWYIRMGLDRLGSRYADFLQGLPANLQDMLDALASLETALRTNVHDDIADVRMAVEDWQGAAAESFKAYLGAVETATENQLALVSEFSTVIAAHKALAERMRTDAMAIADQTITALENVKDDDGSGLGMVLEVAGIVVGTVVAAATVPVTGGASGFVVGAIFASGALQAAGTVASAQEAAVTVAGENPDDIIYSMYDGLTKLDRFISDEESFVRAGLAKLSEGMDTYRDVLYPPFVQSNRAGQSPPNIYAESSYTLDDFRPPGAEPTGSGATVTDRSLPNLGDHTLTPAP